MLYKLYRTFLRCILNVLCGCLKGKTAKNYGVRHYQMVLLFFGLLLAYAMRVNMSIAIVAMVDPVSHSAFDWNIREQSMILSSFFWGYILLQIPGGVLANKYGGNILIAIAIGINSAIVLLIPLCGQIGGWKLICACRIVQGISQGLVFPSVHNLIGKWAPVEEKSRLGTFVYAGSYLGTALQLVTAGYIVDRWGWPMVFYSVGFLGVIWTFLYVQLGSSSPQTSLIISAEERELIQESLGVNLKHKTLITPWMSIMTSKPFIALIIVHCGQNWGFWTLLTEIPSYMKQVLGVDIKSNGVLSALPYLTMYFLTFPLGYTLDFALKKEWVTLSGSRKLSNSIGFYGAAVALIALAFAPSSNVYVTVILLVVAVSVNAGHITGFLLVHIDMAPNFAGALMGITNFLGNIVSIISPLVAGVILEDEADSEQWCKVFYLAAVVYVVTNTIFVVWGTSERQEWDQHENTKLAVNATEKTAEKIV